MKRLVIITAALALVFTLLAGCGGDENKNAATTQLQGGQQQQGQQGGQKSPESQSQGGQQQSGGGQMIEPQQLISRQEAAQLAGEPVKDPIKEEQQMLGLKLCLYVAEKPDSKSYMMVAVVQQGAMQGGGGGESGGQSGGEGGGGESGGHGGGGGESGGQGGQGGQGGGGGGQQEMTPKSLFEALKKTLADPNADAGRIGEEAFLSAPGISILSGEYYIYVAASAADPAMTPQIIKQAGELAVNNLKRLLGQ